MPIKGISDIRELPRLGKIRLGTKKLSSKGNEYPDESPEFVLNPIEEVLDKNGNPVMDRATGKPMFRENEHIKALMSMFGPNPAELKVVFPVDDMELICPQYMKWWGGNAKKKKSSLTCKGTGEWAFYKGEHQVGGMDVPQYPMVPENLFRHFPQGFNRKCLGPSCTQAQPQGGKPAQCKANMDLFFLVPEYSMFGVFHISTTSFQAIKAVNSCLEVAKSALRLQGIPNITGVPMKLFRKRTPNSQGGVNYIMQLEADVRELEVQKTLFLDKKSSTLGLGMEKFTISNLLLDEPDYDLLPQSEHGRLQTGDDLLAIEAPTTAPAETIDDWVTDPEIGEKFKALGQLKGVPVTKAKMKATAKNHDSKESLSKYLDDQLAVGA